MKILPKVFWFVLALGLLVGTAIGFDGDPTPRCRPDGGNCIPPAR